jgi:5-methylcytosine-specific restriction endonuclease McrA
VSALLRRLLLQAALSNRQTQSTTSGLRTRCLHCRTWLGISANGAAIGAVTLEHIVPQTWFGKPRALDQLFADLTVMGFENCRPAHANDVRNLALACERCNQAKGRSHDRFPMEEKSRQVIRALFIKRMALWQDVSDEQP